MKRLILITGIVLFLAASLHLTVSVVEAQYSSVNYNEIGGARFVVGGDIDIVEGGELNIEDGGDFYMEPTDTTPTAAIGWIYFDLSETALTYHNGSGWVTLTTGSGDNTLDDAYDEPTAGAGRSITADTGAVAIANTDADTAFLLTLGANPSGSAALGGMEVTLNSNSTENGIEFENAGSGDDVQGTGDTWSFTKTGVLTAVSGVIPTMTVATLLDATSGITLDNDETITNSTDTEIKFAEDGGEDFIFDMDAASNAVGLKSSTGVDELAFGTVDDLSGIGSLAFDAAASTVTLAAGAGSQDLTIAVTGAYDSSLHLAAAGTGTDAITVKTSAGGMDITVAGSGDGEDLDILSSRSLTLTSSEATADAIKIEASNAAGGIDIDAKQDINILLTASTANEDILIATGGGQDSHVTITADGSSENAFTVLAANGNIDLTGTGAAGEDFDITSTNSSLNLTSGEDHIDSMVLNSSGGVNIDAADNIDILLTANSSDEDINIATGGTQDSHISIDADGSSVNALGLVASVGGVVLSSATTMDIDSTGIFTLNQAGDTLTIQVDSDNGGDDLTLKVDGDDDASIILDSDGSGADAIKLNASHATTGGIAIDYKSGNMTITGSGASADFLVDCDLFSIDGTGAANISVTGGGGEDFTVSQLGTGDDSLFLTSAGNGTDAIKIETSDAAGDIDINAGDAITVDAGDIVFTTDDTAADQFKVLAGGTVSGMAVTLQTTEGGIRLLADGDTEGDIDIDCEDDMTLTSAGDFTLAVTGTTTLPDNQLRRAVIAIADTEMDLLNGTPKELVPTPGASAYIEFVSATFALDWGGTAWVENSAPDDLVIRYTNGSGALVSELLDATGFATAVADSITHLNPASDIIAGTTAKPTVLATASVNQPLVLHNTGDNWTNSGNSQVVVIIYYRIHTLTELGL